MSERWRKSSRSQGNADSNCVEARLAETGAAEAEFQVRDSKLGHDSPIFNLDAQEFTSLLRAAQR